MQKYHKYSIQNYLNISIYYNLININIKMYKNNVKLNFKKNSIMFRKILNLIIFNIYYSFCNIITFKFNKLQCIYFDFSLLLLLSSKSILFFYNPF